MNYAQSLRVIGQALELAKVSAFTLESDGQNYRLQSDSMSRTAEWMLRYVTGESDLPTSGHRRAPENQVKSLDPKPVPFSQTVIARLDQREANRRRSLTQSPQQMSGKLSHLLRTLGDHLDRNSARRFQIFWMADAIVLDYQRADGFTDRQRFTPEKLIQVGNSRSRPPSLEQKNK